MGALRGAFFVLVLPSFPIGTKGPIPVWAASAWTMRSFSHRPVDLPTGLSSLSITG
jgi:hypothetical protein